MRGRACARPGAVSGGWLADFPHLHMLQTTVAGGRRDGSDTGPLLWMNSRYVISVDERRLLEAVEAAERYRPDLVLLDIGMPKLDGYAACRRIREQPWGRDLLIVALTGWGQEDDRRRSQGAGFDRHLVKPVAPSELLRLLDEWQGKRPGPGVVGENPDLRPEGEGWQS